MFKDEGSDLLETKVADGPEISHLLNMKLDIESSIFNNAIKKHSVLVLDAKSELTPAMRSGFEERFKLKNTLAIPMYSRGRVLGILGIGNNQGNFKYREEDIELLDIFVKNIVMAMESDRLRHKVEKLEIKDALTGLYNESFIRSRLEKGEVR